MGHITIPDRHGVGVETNDEAAWRLLKLAGRFGVCLSNREVPAGIPVC